MDLPDLDIKVEKTEDLDSNYNENGMFITVTTNDDGSDSENEGTCFYYQLADRNETTTVAAPYEVVRDGDDEFVIIVNEESTEQQQNCDAKLYEFDDSKIVVKNEVEESNNSDQPNFNDIVVKTEVDEETMTVNELNDYNVVKTELEEKYIEETNNVNRLNFKDIVVKTEDDAENIETSKTTDIPNFDDVVVKTEDHTKNFEEIKSNKKTKFDYIIIKTEKVDENVYISDTPPEMQSTENSINDALFSCQQCDFKTDIMDKISLHIKKHLEQHKNSRSYECKFCRKCFETAQLLQNHKNNNHRPDKPYMCTKCNFSSKYPSTIKRHMSIHKPVRPYKCPSCSYAASTANQLNDHIRKHTDEKLYRCDFCGLSFSDDTTLISHRLIKHTHSTGPIQCSCGMELPDSFALKIHLKPYHEET